MSFTSLPVVLALPRVDKGSDRTPLDTVVISKVGTKMQIIIVIVNIVLCVLVFGVTKRSRISGDRRVSIHADVIKSFRLSVRLKQFEISGTNFCDLIIKPITGAGVYGSQKFLEQLYSKVKHVLRSVFFPHKSDDFFFPD